MAEYAFWRRESEDRVSTCGPPNPVMLGRMSIQSLRKRVRLLLAIGAAVAMTMVASPASGTSQSPERSGPGVVRVDTGWLRGDVAEDHVTYSAVPYAAPPVGERRWRPPARPLPWSGLRDATNPTPFCPQAGPEGFLGTEDCLYLEVTSPRGIRAGERLPVLVWLHGGAFSSGGAAEFNGADLATNGRMVVVTINYRLGALGFLSSPSLDASGGNYGLMDQTAALQWVRRNVASFGGDPRNVTLAGQSAGARAVCAQLASPLARGLFHRAISQSGACDNRVPELAEARAFGARATEQLGCATATDVAACLREQPPAKLIGVLADQGRGVHGRVSDRPWNPVAGTRVLPRQPADALRDGTAAGVPLLIGSTRDEMRVLVSSQATLTEQRYREMMAETFGGAAATVLAEYPAAAYDSPALALSAVLSDWGGSIGSCPVLRTAEAASAHQRVYVYEFAEDSGQATNGFPWGSYHGLELPYFWDLSPVWGDYYLDLDDRQQQLSATLMEYWSAFAHTGNPNEPGRPYWQPFNAKGTVIALSTSGIAPTAYAADHRCALWERLPR